MKYEEKPADLGEAEETEDMEGTDGEETAGLIGEESCEHFYGDIAGRTDDEVAEMAADGDEVAAEYLLIKYKNFVRGKARSYFLVGADREDIIQEGMIGLYKAMRDFKTEKKASFHAFADICVTRQIITAIKTATRQKHKPLNTYVSLSRPVYDEECERTLVDVLEGNRILNPEEIIIDNEELSLIEGKIGELLSSFEKQVLELYLQGRSYAVIAKMVKKSPKSVDNALQRIKGKLEHLGAKS